MLDVNLEPVFKAIQKQKPKLVLLQFPEGLKTRLKQITEKLEETTNVTIVSLIEPCFGACMLAETKAQLLGADLLVHFGHSRFYPEKIPTIFVPLEYKISETQLQKTIETIAQELSQKKLNRIGLVTTIQYLNALLPIQKRLEKKGFSVLIGMGQNVLAGQVLGCNFSSALFIIEKVDTIVYVGDGTFHPIGIGLALKKPVFSISPMESEWTEMGNEKESFLKKRLAIIGSLHEARSFGILVSTQTGQLHLSQALEAKKEIEKNGKKALILAADLLSPDFVLGITVDCLVNTACPRITSDDSANYWVPVISVKELPFVLGTKKLETFGNKNLI